ncbi:hypothetical protein CO725_00860 [Vibrio parahaemolyticus]|uniref:hypothetical protein n=1 Tax=Vibrio parahaemolyticus TaxID=670 RepID=UPI000BE24FB2|nr:hypothetical protein [Vibrio parahaemolyticus]ATI44236.1 hypothetical protein CO725_00860 [Vibrio parahaemolyticus]
MSDNTKLLSEVLDAEETTMDEKEKQIYMDMQHIVKRQDEKNFEVMQLRFMVIVMFLISVFQSVFFLKLIF